MTASTRKTALMLRKTYKEYSQDYVKKIIGDIMFMSVNELLDKMADNETPAIEMALGAIMLKTIKSGDPQGINFLFDRSIGKIKEERYSDLPPEIEYITEVNIDGNLVRSAIESQPLDERNLTIDMD